MNKELTPSEIIFSPLCRDDVNRSVSTSRIQNPNIFEKIKKALMIKKYGFNIYYVDSFSNERVQSLIKYVEKVYKSYEAPKDICYATYENEYEPKVLFLNNGMGIKLKDDIEEIKEKYYDIINDFYAASDIEKKEAIIESINKERNNYISNIMEMAKKENFDVKATTGGFVFIPLKDTGSEMTQDEYDDLEENTQENIEKQAAELKNKAEEILEKLKDIEIEAIDKLKIIYSDYIKENMQQFKDDILMHYMSDDKVYRYLVEVFENIDDDIVDCYTINREDDEEIIKKAIEKYEIKLLVDNSNILHPRVIYEDDPSAANLIGNIEYKNSNGSYSTDISLITAGSLALANEGCIILRLSSLINSNNGAGYYYLKKALMSGKIDYSYSKSYLDVLSVAGLKPEPIEINTKVILIGDYESFSILYEKDEDFKKLFPIKIEYKAEVDYTAENHKIILDNIMTKINNDKLLKITDEAASEIIRYMVRISGSRDKISADEYYVNRILYLADSNARYNKKKTIDRRDIFEVIYEDEDILKSVMENYKNRKILLTVDEKKVGIVNGLAVVGTDFYSFGKPMRITCQCVQGSGNIIDIHKESKMSGSIHEKSIGILHGLLSNLFTPYEKLPVDFQLSFEQTYGMIEGDSASVAEIICILSALSRKPVRQNIAVTGSINQFGEVQPIGGVNEKIEGFFKVCSVINTVQNKGVLIPASDKDELILNYKVEDSIKKGEFHIYTMDSLEDAIRILILDENEDMKMFIKDIESEISKYKNIRKKNGKKA